MGKPKVVAMLFAVVGVVLFSAKAVMVKLAYQYDVDAMSLLLFRMLFALPVYIVILTFLPKERNKDVRKSDYLWLVLFGFLGFYMASYLDFLGLQYIKASIERIILFIYPTIVIIFTRVFLKVKINTWQIIAIGITYIGVVLTFYEELNLTNQDHLWIGSFFVLGSAITFAGYLVGSGWLIPKFGSARFTAYAMIIACSFVILHNLLFNEHNIWSFQAEVYYYGFAMAIFATVIPTFLVSEAIKHIGPSNFGIIGSLGPISTIILANIFLDEHMTLLQIFGTLVVIGGILVLARRRFELRNEADIKR